MYILKSMFSAFSMYSKIIVPKTEWNEENRRYSLCFFPLIGVVLGGLIVGWYFLCKALFINRFLFAAGCVSIPIIVTGGIHLDGFCDVADASASWGSKEKLLEIMNDSHIGAFAAIKLAVYILLQTAVYTEIFTFKEIFICSTGFVMSRALSGIAAVSFKGAKNSGALAAFSSPAHKKVTVICELLYIFSCTVLMLFVSIPTALTVTVATGGLFVYYHSFSYRRFGGITGDLAGWFVQLCELVIPVCVLAAEKVVRAMV